MSHVSHKQTQEKLSREMLNTVADRRARGGSWESVSAEFGWKPDDLRNATDTPEFAEHLEHAQTMVASECEAEMLMSLRKQMRSQIEAVSLKATLAMAKFLESKQRAKLAMMRAEVAIAKANVKNHTIAHGNHDEAKTKAKPRTQSQPQPQPQFATSAAPPTLTAVTPASRGTQSRVSAGVDLSLAPLG